MTDPNMPPPPPPLPQPPDPPFPQPTSRRGDDPILLPPRPPTPPRPPEYEVGRARVGTGYPVPHGGTI